MADLTDLVLMPGQDYKNICDAIRTKNGQTEDIVSGEAASLILNLPTGTGIDIDLNLLTAGQDQVLQGYDFLSSDGVIKSGNIPSKVLDEDSYAITTIMKENYFTSIAFTEETFAIPEQSVSFIHTPINEENFGTAGPEQVLSGYTFSSKDGIVIPGQLQISGGTPGNFSSYKTGIYTPTSDTACNVSITHNLGQSPDFVCIYAVNSSSNYGKGYLISSFGTKTVGTSWQGIYLYYSQLAATGAGKATFMVTNTTFNINLSSLKYKAGINYEWIVGKLNN